MYVHASALYTCRHVRSCCMQLTFPGGGPADPLLVRLWLGKAGARCPNIAGQGKVLGLCRFLRKRSVSRGGARSAFGCPNSGSARQASAARTMPGKANFWDFAVFLGKSWPWWRGRWGGPACLRLPGL
jgi:hypothetical protein